MIKIDLKKQKNIANWAMGSQLGNDFQLQTTIFYLLNESYVFFCTHYFEDLLLINEYNEINLYQMKMQKQYTKSIKSTKTIYNQEYKNKGSSEISTYLDDKNVKKINVITNFDFIDNYEGNNKICFKNICDKSLPEKWINCIDRLITQSKFYNENKIPKKDFCIRILIKEILKKIIIDNYNDFYKFLEKKIKKNIQKLPLIDTIEEKIKMDKEIIYSYGKISSSILNFTSKNDNKINEILLNCVWENLDYDKYFYFVKWKSIEGLSNVEIENLNKSLEESGYENVKNINDLIKMI